MSNEFNLDVSIENSSYPLDGEENLDILLEKIGDSKYVLIGEASHGTSEFYEWRSLITKRLIEERGFSFIGVEGDWPDCYEINRFVKNQTGITGFETLNKFNRWPTWMWANYEVLSFIKWLRDYNDKLDDDKKVGFYGLDVYSLWESLNEVIKYLEEKNGETLDSAKRAFSCFEPFSGDMEQYARTNLFVSKSCENEVLYMLRKIVENKEMFDDSQDNVFDLEQNALVVKNADNYYRTMILGNAQSWNIRDNHMVETIERLIDHHGEDSKCIIWAHNTHVGDARYTDMTQAGMVNIGQLIRERYPNDTFIIGFGSYEGSVIAGSSWGDEMKEMNVPSANENSFEYILHNTFARDRMLLFDIKDHEKFLEEVVNKEAINKNSLQSMIGHRAIGVVYNPQMDYGNYVPTIVPLRYDAFLYIDRSKALHPIHMEEIKIEEMETYPFKV